MQFDEMTNSWVDSIVNQHRNLNFVDRIARPQIYPTFPVDDRTIATHQMSWSTTGKEQTPIVYPHVIFDPETRKLKQLKPDEAYEYAIQSGEFIPFSTSQAAETFSREYKRHWRNGKEPKHRGDVPQQ